MKLSEFLQERLAGRGTQAKFSRETGISDGTVSKWARGDLDRAPNFENCIWIAKYFGETPADIFLMAERTDYLRLFENLFPEYGTKRLSATEQRGCCKEHFYICRMLEDILHEKESPIGPIGDWITGNIKTFHATLRQTTPGSTSHEGELKNGRRPDPGPTFTTRGKEIRGRRR